MGTIGDHDSNRAARGPAPDEVSVLVGAAEETRVPVETETDRAHEGRLAGAVRTHNEIQTRADLEGHVAVRLQRAGGGVGWGGLGVRVRGSG